MNKKPDPELTPAVPESTVEPAIVEPPELGRKDVSEPTAREKIARDLAIALFILITLVILLIAGDWLYRTPTMPALSSAPTTEGQKVALDYYKTLNEVAMERATKMFDLMVVKALLPVFATVVGYLLGRRDGRG